MPTVRKVLGQSRPDTVNNTNLYTVPSGTQAVVSTLSVSNVGSVSAAAKVFIRASGATADNVNKFMHDVVIPVNSVFTATIGITLSAGDIITVQSTVASGLTFILFGEDIS